MKSPYESGYGLKWPSSGIVSDVYRNLKNLPSLTRAIDFGCGLGSHGRFIESLGFAECYYVDSDPVALAESKRFLRDFPTATKRHHFETLHECINWSFDLIIDRASLQHVNPNQLVSTLDQITFLLDSRCSMEKSIRTGILVSEWVVSASKENQTQRFSNVTFFEEIKEILLEKFILLSLSYQLTTRFLESEIVEFKVANLVLKPRI